MPSPVFSELTPADAAQLEQLRSRHRDVLGRLGVAEAEAAEASVAQRLGWLQAIVDRKLVAADPRETLLGLGVEFGDLLCSIPAFRWAIITDEHGRDPVVRWRSSETNISALTIIAKRIESGEQLDVAELFRFLPYRCALLQSEGAR